MRFDSSHEERVTVFRHLRKVWWWGRVRKMEIRCWEKRIGVFRLGEGGWHKELDSAAQNGDLSRVVGLVPCLADTCHPGGVCVLVRKIHAQQSWKSKILYFPSKHLFLLETFMTSLVLYCIYTFLFPIILLSEYFAYSVHCYSPST